MSRTFGVEVECGHVDGIPAVVELLRGAGLNAGTHVTQRGWWNVGHDGSGVEARSPILSGPAGFKELRTALKAIHDGGGVVTQRDGLHVHHGIPDLLSNKDAIVRLVRSWMDNSPHIHAFIARRRSGRSAYNPDWTEDQFNDLFENGTTDRHVQQRYNYTTGRYDGPKFVAYCGPRGSLNLRSLSEHGTVELRAHEGTLDPDIAEAWVRFGQRFINAVVNRKRPIPRCDSPEELLRKVRLGQGVAVRLLDKPARDSTYIDIRSFRARRQRVQGSVY